MGTQQVEPLDVDRIREDFPILDREETVKGAISVAGPSSRFQGTRFHEELPQLVLDAANVIELNITYG